MKPNQFGLREEFLKSLGPGFSLGMVNPAYDFLSADEKWTVSLTSDFLSLTSRDYHRWERFKDHLAEPLSALLEVYCPSFLTRIGLRYRDVIRRSSYGLQDVPWSTLLQPQIAGELSVDEVAPAIQHTAETIFAMPNNMGRLRVLHGLSSTDASGEKVFVIDSDLFTDERKDPTDAWKILDYFNRQARCFFQWCITPKLHAALEPEG